MALAAAWWLFHQYHPPIPLPATRTAAIKPRITIHNLRDAGDDGGATLEGGATLATAIGGFGGSVLRGVLKGPFGGGAPLGGGADTIDKSESESTETDVVAAGLTAEAAAASDVA